MTLKTSAADFINGLVFGFDVGTGSIGYAIRKGNKFLDVGVLICPEPKCAGCAATFQHGERFADCS